MRWNVSLAEPYSWTMWLNKCLCMGGWWLHLQQLHWHCRTHQNLTTAHICYWKPLETDTSLWNSSDAIVAEQNDWIFHIHRNWQTLILCWPHFGYQHAKRNSRIANRQASQRQNHSVNQQDPMFSTLIDSHEFDMT